MLERYVLQQAPSSDVSKVINEEKKLKIFLQEIKKQTQLFSMDLFGGQDIAPDLAGMKKQLQDLPARIDGMDQEQMELFWDIMNYIELKMQEYIPQEESWPGAEERFHDRRLELTDPDVKL